MFNEGVGPPRACRTVSKTLLEGWTPFFHKHSLPWGVKTSRGWCLINTDMDEALCLSHSDFYIRTPWEKLTHSFVTWNPMYKQLLSCIDMAWLRAEKIREAPLLIRIRHGSVKQKLAKPDQLEKVIKDQLRLLPGDCSSTPTGAASNKARFRHIAITQGSCTLILAGAMSGGSMGGDNNLAIPAREKNKKKYYHFNAAWWPVNDI